MTDIAQSDEAQRGRHAVTTHRTMVAVGLAIVLAIAPLCATTPEDADGRARAIARELMSPFCPGLLLADCKSSGAFELRDEILARVRTGESTVSIEDDLAARFGESIRAMPAFHGVGAFVWAFPIVVAAIALLVCLRTIVSLTRREAQFRDELAVADLGAMDQERVQDALDEFD